MFVMSNIQKQITKLLQLQSTKRKHHGRFNRGHTIIHPNLEKVGAIVLTAVCMLVTVEGIVEHQTHSKKEHYGDEAQLTNQIFARNETKGETARLPEEFDIGLQTPHISGL